jgi:hypothetical protein
MRYVFFEFIPFLITALLAVHLAWSFISPHKACMCMTNTANGEIIGFVGKTSR